jgi:GTP pyrophosphokinase
MSERDDDKLGENKPSLKKKQVEVLTPEESLQKFFRKLQLYIQDQSSLVTIQKAYQFAADKHSNQKRSSGEPYICHPIAVAEVLADLKVDVTTLVSALLHDVVEDTGTSLDEIRKEFGAETADIVDGLTKLAKIQFNSKQERMAENFRKMIIAMAKDLRVIIIKLADRLHNMRTLRSLPGEKRRRIAQETLDIYSPLAGRLGIYNIKSELEDLCLKETKYEIYKEIRRNISSKKKEREVYIKEVVEILENELKKYGFKNVKVSGRPKHFYSIYKKMVDRQLAFQDIHDLFAFRILVDSIKDCYEAVGIVHAMWKPMPGRFKDYIAMPKPNYYQSLHTTVIRPNGTPAEIQIRTHDMHRICEFGIAAHWSYKEQTSQKGERTDLEKFAWLRQMMELQKEVEDPSEFLAAIKVDLFEEEIFVFTPQGDVIQLPVGATPLDFAFSVHTDVGVSAVGAKVNGRITPLRGKLHSGDIVEIFTSPNQRPSKDWLNFVISSKARSKIRSFFRYEERSKSKKIGKDILADELQRKDLDITKLGNKLDLLLKASRESSLDELYAAIGYGRINVPELLEKVFPEQIKEKTETFTGKIHPESSPSKNIGSGVLVSGLDNILVTFGKCCNPLPGEEIFGFITRGRGVSVHRIDCSRGLDLDPARRVFVSWRTQDEETASHKVYLRILTSERQGVLADVTVAISSCAANIQKAQVKVSSDNKGIFYFEISIRDLAHLRQVIKKIETIPDVILVERQNSGGIKKHKTKKP